MKQGRRLVGERNFFMGSVQPEPSTKVVVIVPVRNEEEHIWNTLEALRCQYDDKHAPVNFSIYEVLVLINNCTDRSLNIALNYQNQYPEFRLIIEEISLPAKIAYIGTVRRILMDAAYNRLMQHNNENGIIASIDGDTVADNQWLHFIMDEITNGNDAVGGRILTNEKAGRAHLHYLRDITYRLLLTQAESLIDPLINDPLPRHFQYFGANMAVTCKMYDEAGRIPKIRCLEDMAFHKALIKHDARIRKSFKVKVYTSARLDGRVSIGFSEQLKKWADEEQNNIPQMVEHVDISLSLFTIRARLRKLWQAGKLNEASDIHEITILAHLLETEPEWLQHHLSCCKYFGEFWELISNDHLSCKPKQTEHLQPVQKAIEQLRRFVKNAEAISFQIDLNDKYLSAG